MFSFLFYFFVFFSFSFAKTPFIVVSSYPLTKAIHEACPSLQFYSLVPPSGEFHTWNLGVKDWVLIKKADLVFIVGTEPWAKRVYALKKKGKLLALTQKEKLPDPHVWFDLERVKRRVKEFFEILSKYDKSSFLKCERHLVGFLKRLSELEKLRKSFKGCKRRKIFVLGHPVFYYLLNGTGIKEIDLYSSFVHAYEPSLKNIYFFIKQAKRENQDYLFITEPEFLKFKDFFQNQGFKVIYLWSGGVFKEGNFTELVRDNLLNIKKSLVCGF